MHGYFNDIHFINVARKRHCVTDLAPFRFADRASLELLCAGRLRYIVNRQTYVVTAPALFWNVPGKTYAYKTFPDTPRDHAWVDFAGPRARRIARALDRLAPRNFIAIDNPGLFVAIFDEMIKIHAANDPTSFFKLAVELERLIGLIYETIRQQNIFGAENARWHKLTQELASRPFDAWDFRDQSRRLGMSYTHFRRQFREVIGAAPHDYLLACRARRIVRELQTRKISIKQLAYEHGYSDPATLSRLVKAKLGITPSSLTSSRHRSKPTARAQP